MSGVRDLAWGEVASSALSGRHAVDGCRRGVVPRPGVVCPSCRRSPNVKPGHSGGTCCFLLPKGTTPGHAWRHTTKADYNTCYIINKDTNM